MVFLHAKGMKENRLTNIFLKQKQQLNFRCNLFF